jgi:hypothetical protein
LNPIFFVPTLLSLPSPGIASFTPT